MERGRGEERVYYQSINMKIAVVGAGIAGISSAIAVQKAFPNAKVTIISDKFSPDLTSDIAAGFWFPYLLAVDDPHLMRRICMDTFAYISSLVAIEGTGAMWQSGYVLNKEEEEDPDWKDIVKGYRRLSKEELRRFGGQHKSGSFFTTLALEGTAYIAYATRIFLSQGGSLKQGRIADLNQLIDEFDVVVNCTGLGARELVNDKEVIPIRGQIIRVRAPKVKHFFTDGDLYCLLNGDRVILGGTHDEGEWDIVPKEEVARMILEENTKIFPELKEATVLSHHVGLRPFRSKLRLEKETVRKAGKEVPIIHNYGHGGSGLTIFWGCALQVVNIIRPHLPLSHL